MPLEKEIEIYRQQHTKSLALWEKAKKCFPGGICHNIRDFHMSGFGLCPPFIEEGKGSKLFDADGNTYLDYWITHYAAILGHSHEAIIKAISEQLPKGNHFGMVNEKQLILAEKVIEATPSIRELRFCTTGTEATMYASRLARAFTGKKLIAKVKGGWHGGNDTLFYFVKHLEDGVESIGIRSQEEAGIITFDYNDITGAIKLIRENKQELAAIVIEPVLGAGGGIAPREGFLETIREETEKNDILLIFDEIITGFRLGYTSGQGYFGVLPDLTTMGKILGGGAPIGLVGGREDIMEQANLPKGGNVWIGGGTFSGNPVSMVAGIATLDVLKNSGKELYQRLNNNGEKMRKRIKEILEEYEAPAVVTGICSMAYIHWLKKRVLNIETGTELAMNLDPEKVAKFQLYMFNREVLVRGGLGALSIKHTEEDLERTINAIDEAIKALIKGD